MSDVARAVRENFELLVVALQCDMMNQPANDRRMKITAALAKIDVGVHELEQALQ